VVLSQGAEPIFSIFIYSRIIHAEFAAFALGGPSRLLAAARKMKQTHFSVFAFAFCSRLFSSWHKSRFAHTLCYCPRLCGAEYDILLFISLLCFTHTIKCAHIRA
jgi:hypothetical protein